VRRSRTPISNAKALNSSPARRASRERLRVLSRTEIACSYQRSPPPPRFSEPDRATRPCPYEAARWGGSWYWSKPLDFLVSCAVWGGRHPNRYAPVPGGESVGVRSCGSGAGKVPVLDSRLQAGNTITPRFLVKRHYRRLRRGVISPPPRLSRRARRRARPGSNLEVGKGERRDYPRQRAWVHLYAFPRTVATGTRAPPITRLPSVWPSQRRLDADNSAGASTGRLSARSQLRSGRSSDLTAGGHPL